MDKTFWRMQQTIMGSSGQPSASNYRQLENHLNKLTLICWSMWTLLLEKTDLTEEDLFKRMKDLDLLDGTADGKVTQQIAKCSKCDRIMSPNHQKCLYCGAEKLMVSAFDHFT